MKALTRVVKQEAQRQGFALMGVTTPAPPASFALFDQWLKDGCQAEMSYLATERSRNLRSNPQAILPEARSILMLALHYPSAELALPSNPFLPHDRTNGGLTSPPLTGKIAAYACGSDYHDILPRRLAALASFIAEHSPAAISQRWYTDTGAVLERDLAQRAGLGWIGKNGCLIHPAHGSYTLLAEIFSAAELTPDEAFVQDRCGSCTRCIQACPTACIRPERTVNSRRCLAYLNIELKGSIPRELRPAMRDWVFGCDICQQVCPWNKRRAGEVQEGKVDLIQEMTFGLTATPQAFNLKYKNTPIKRAKRRGYLRNVAVCLGNSADPQAIPILSQTLGQEGEALIRAHAAWALGNIGGSQAHQSLENARRTEPDASVLQDINCALEGNI